MQRAGDLNQRAEFGEVATNGGGAGGNSDLADEPRQFGFVLNEDELVGVGEAETDSIGVRQFDDAGDSLAVHERAVTAVHVLDKVPVVADGDARVDARDAVIAQNKVILGEPADEERRLGQRHPAAVPTRIHHGQDSMLLVAFPVHKTG